VRQRSSERPLVLLTAIVIAISGLLFIRLNQQIRGLSVLRRQQQAQPLGAATPTGLLTAYTPDGRRITEPSSPNVRWVVIFVLHTDHEQSELASWQNVSSEINDERLLFLACCQDRECLLRLNHPSFPVVTDLPLLLARALVLGDQEGYFLVVDSSVRGTYRLPWTRPARVAALLRSVRDNGFAKRQR